MLWFTAQRIPATIGSCLVVFCLGLGSALNLNFLENQVINCDSTYLHTTCILSWPSYYLHMIITCIICLYDSLDVPLVFNEWLGEGTGGMGFVSSFKCISPSYSIISSCFDALIGETILTKNGCSSDLWSPSPRSEGYHGNYKWFKLFDRLWKSWQFCNTCNYKLSCCHLWVIQKSQDMINCLKSNLSRW